MLYHFKDRNRTIKHLAFILEACKFTDKAIMITQSMVTNVIDKQILYYDNKKQINEELRSLFKEMKLHAKLVNDMEKQRQIGFSTAVGEEVEHDDSELCDEEE